MIDRLRLDRNPEWPAPALGADSRRLSDIDADCVAGFPSHRIRIARAWHSQNRSAPMKFAPPRQQPTRQSIRFIRSGRGAARGGQIGL